MRVFYYSHLPIQNYSNCHNGRQPYMFHQSMLRHGIAAQNLTLGKVYTWHRQHDELSEMWPAISSALLACAPDELVLFTDSWDAFFCCGLDEIEAKYREFRVPIVFAVESTLWPPQAAKYGEYPKSPTHCRYINGGGLVGTAQAIYDFYKRTWVDTSPPGDFQWNNQYAMHVRAIRHPEEFIGCLDYYCRIFQVVSGSAWGDIEIRNQRIYNKTLNQYPCIAHFPGGHAHIGLQYWQQLEHPLPVARTDRNAQRQQRRALISRRR